VKWSGAGFPRLTCSCHSPPSSKRIFFHPHFSSRVPQYPTQFSMGGYTSISDRKTRVSGPIRFLTLCLLAVPLLFAGSSFADSPAAALANPLAPSLVGTSPLTPSPSGEVAVIPYSQPRPQPQPQAVEAQSISGATTPHPHMGVSTVSQTVPAHRVPTAITPRPLTRAATQLRIDEMSPVGWLSRFGSVSIGQRH
jgi:hypothetical protein